MEALSCWPGHLDSFCAFSGGEEKGRWGSPGGDGVIWDTLMSVEGERVSEG